MAIARPKKPGGRDRDLDCQEAMEECVHDVMDEALAAGWSPAEATAAVMELANAWALTQIANARTEADIERAKGRRPN